MERDNVPDCCLGCKHFDYDYSEYSGETQYGCSIGVIIPITKKSCAKQATWGGRHGR